MRIRDARERVRELKVLAARGLTLTEVGYPADDLLAPGPTQTRARRELDAGGCRDLGVHDGSDGAIPDRTRES